MKSIRYTAFAFLALIPGARAAPLTDGDATLICAVVDLASCVPGDGCERETADTMNVPHLLTIDRKARDVTGQRPNGERLSTNIDRMTLEQDLLVLGGIQEDLSWSMSIAGTSGRMSLVAVGDGNAFTVFGSCESK